MLEPHRDLAVCPLAKGQLKGFLSKQKDQGEGTPTGRGWDVSPGTEARVECSASRRKSSGGI